MGTGESGEDQLAAIGVALRNAQLVAVANEVRPGANNTEVSWDELRETVWEVPYLPIDPKDVGWSISCMPGPPAGPS